MTTSVSQIPTGWLQQDTVVFYVPKYHGTKVASPHLAGFDWFGTLIHSDRGDRMIRTDFDWVWHSEGTPKFLLDLYNKGWTVVIFSNQRSFSDLQTLQNKYQMMVRDLNFEPYLVISFANDLYAKPNPGMYQLFLQLIQLQQPSQASFFVGDNMRGLVGVSNPLYLQGDMDYGFALRTGLAPYTPEEVLPAQPEYIPTNQREFVITVGQQGATKSTFAEYLKTKYGFFIIKRDGQKHIPKLQQLFSQGRNVVFDATNPGSIERKPLLDLAKQYGYRTIIAYASIPGRVYNSLRQRAIPEIALEKYTRNFEQPRSFEADQIYRIN